MTVNGRMPLGNSEFDCRRGLSVKLTEHRRWATYRFAFIRPLFIPAPLE